MGRIIKAAELPDSAELSACADGGFIDLSHQVQAVLDQARHEAARIVAGARQQSEQIRSEAERQGRQQAVRAAEQQLGEELDRRLSTVVPALCQALDELRTARASHLNQCEAGVLRLASAIAARLVRRELETSPEIPLDLLREALELATGCQQIKIRLAPADCQALGSGVAELIRAAAEGVTAELIPDASVSRGGCIVQTEFGTIDQRFESQLARIAEELV